MILSYWNVVVGSSSDFLLSGACRGIGGDWGVTVTVWENTVDFLAQVTPVFEREAVSKVGPI